MRKKRKILNLENLLKLVGVIVIAFFTLFPLYWTINVSLLPKSEVIKSAPHLYPPPSLLTLDSYREIFTEHQIGRYLLNSVLIVFLASLVSVFLGFAIAYALTKYNFRFKNSVYYIIIWFMALPWVVYVLPLFEVANKLNLLDTHILMILLYGFSGIPLFSWYALPYVQDFPDELIDAGRLDGCSEWGIVLRVVFPVLRNAFIVLFILRFVGAYNDLLYSLCFTFHKAKMIMPALLEFPGQFDIPYPKMAAGGFVAVLPIIFIVIVFQRWVVSGLVGRTFK